MRTFICCLSLVAWTWLSHVSAQEQIEKSIPLSNAQTIKFDFQYANATISSWDKNEIQILGTVNINDNQENEKFDLSINRENNQIYIRSKAKNLNRKQFNTIKDCCPNKKNSRYNYTLDINLEIKVPKNLNLVIDATYGELNLNAISATALKAKSVYGGVTATLQEHSIKEAISLESGYSFVDLSLPRSFPADMELRSNYGEVFTNLEIQTQTKNGLKSLYNTIIRAKLNGGGQNILLKASYDNIYLRALE